MTEEQLDSDGKPATFLPGERVWVPCVKMHATVINQILFYDCGESFWGNVKVMFADGIPGTCNSWQLVKLDR
ncbi:MAG: hypothetical protein QXN55_01340 [Candidatus Nitrosotenuis sp.]